MKRQRKKQGDVKRVAIIGVDSSGKTTLLRELEKRLKHDKSYGFYQTSGYAKHGRFFKFLGRFFNKLSYNKKTTPRFVSHAGYTVTMPFARMVKEKDKRVVFFDRYAPLEINAFKEAYKLKKKKKLLPFFRFLTGTKDPDVVVLMRINPEKAMERIEKRGGKQFHESKEVLKKMQEAYEEEIKRLKEKGIKVIEIDSSKMTPEEEARKVLKELKRQV